MAFLAPDEDEQRWLTSFEEVRPLLSLPTEAGLSAQLHELVAQGKESVAVCGLLHAMLHDHSQTSRLFYHLCCCARDGLAFALTELKALVLTRHHRLPQPAKAQLLLVVSKLLEARAPLAEEVVVALLRLVGTGDAASTTLWLCDNLLSLLVHHTPWLLELDHVVPVVFLSFLRLAASHPMEAMRERCERELRFCARLWAAKTRECLELGVDLTLALYPFRHTAILKSVLSAVGLLAPEGEKVRQPSKHASAYHLLSRVTPDAERCLLFMMQCLDEAEPRRHLKWFAERHLHGRGLVAIQDMLRWLCIRAAPSGPAFRGGYARWKLAGWLLQHAMEHPGDGAGHDHQYCVLWALLLDFFHDGAFWLHREPALLLLVHYAGDPLERQATVSKQLLQALLVAPQKLFPFCTHAAQTCIASAFCDFIDRARMGQVPPLQPLLRFDERHFGLTGLSALLATMVQRLENRGVLHLLAAGMRSPTNTALE
ncbi:hypothetical protein AB1Y20_003742 [Prymnesium parvum]|uniref:Integrator complex subunit 3 N-terminal domain-containing protein n=1 Tax=Prymnesium parvum TaxID=97485 RepID=A0AB34J8I9_PRYPA